MNCLICNKDYRPQDIITHYFIVPSGIFMNNSYGVCKNDSEKCLGWTWEDVLNKMKMNFLEKNNIKKANEVENFIDQIKKYRLSYSEQNNEKQEQAK